MSLVVRIRISSLVSEHVVESFGKGGSDPRSHAHGTFCTTSFASVQRPADETEEAVDTDENGKAQSDWAEFLAMFGIDC